MDAPTDASVEFPVLDAASVHAHMLRIFSDVYTRYGTRYSEALYQRAIVRRAYLDGLPTMAERELFVDLGEGALLIGRVDLEVAGTCLYELKIGNQKLSHDTEQIKKYLYAYDLNHENIHIASLVYFTQGGVVVHEIRNLDTTEPSDESKEHGGFL
jgi:hypothetical protein